MRLNRIKLMTAMMERDKRQYELAADIGLSRATINGVCCGRSCKAETARKIAGALGMELKDLIEA